MSEKTLLGIYSRRSKRRCYLQKRDEDEKALFVEWYKAFRELLKSNNKVLMTMAVMQQKASGAFGFERAYVHSSYDTVSDKELGKQTVALAGGKLACLGELAGVLVLAVPPGFIVTTYACQAFIQHNQIRDVLNEKSITVGIRNYDELTATSQEIQELVRNGHIPADLETARGRRLTGNFRSDETKYYTHHRFSDNIMKNIRRVYHAPV